MEAKPFLARMVTLKIQWIHVIKLIYMQAYFYLLKPMKASGFPDMLPPKARRMPGRPNKHMRNEQGEEGA